MTNQPDKKNVQIKITDEVLKGFYSNLMQVIHNREEFVLDFMSVMGPQGTVGARIVVSPAHMKRMLAALSENVKRYEQQFGTINEGPSQAPSGKEFGFKTQS